MNQTTMGASATDRLSFTLFLALAVHAAIVFGISFQHEDPKPAPHTMEITLAQHDDKKKPDKADFLAQSNQQGSGESDKATLPTITEQALVEGSQPNPQFSPPQEPARQVKRKQVDRQLVVTKGKGQRQAPVSEKTEETPEAEKPVRTTLMDRSLEIASLTAQLDRQQQAYAKRPRITRLTAASTMSTTDAYYMKAWLEKVERIGNLNYPEEARKKKIYGRLRLLVALEPDGNVREIRVLHSSGYKILDDAAIRIVRLAAPFAPFPEEVRKERDILEIIRTWSFQEKGMSSY